MERGRSEEDLEPGGGEELRCTEKGKVEVELAGGGGKMG